MNENVKVNDGGGLYDSIGLIDSLILDCNNGMKALISGSPLEYAAVTVGMVQKLGELKRSIKSDMESLEQQIKELRSLLNNEEGVEENAAGSVCDALDGTMGSGEERIRDAFAPAGGGLERSAGDDSP